MTVYPPRSNVAKSETWNAESVFKSQRAWQDELNSVLADLNSVKKYQGRLGESPATLLEALSAYETLFSRAEKVFMYANFAYAVDTADQQAAGAVGKAATMLSQVSAASAYISP